MLLFLSDLHLGRSTPAESRAAETDALALLHTYEDAVVAAGAEGGLVLVGDVFDQFIEYRHLVPKGFVRLQGLLADWTDRGIAVSYLVGNRDPWHLDYFERELGVRVTDTLQLEAYGHRLYAAHGDGLVPSERMYNTIKPILRHRWAYGLYRMLTPGDSGYALARRVARRGHGRPETPIVGALRRAADTRLQTTDTDLVVFGHCHHAECIPMAGGTYLNPGYWFGDRTFGCLDAEGTSLMQWRGGTAKLITGNNPESPHVF